jgi:hypothetical protein
MEIISLGGVGGCQLANALRLRNYKAYPYDWLVTSQSFILNSFDNIDNFFTFDESYVYQNVNLLCENQNAVMLHDFTHFESQKTDVIERYKRRFNRLNQTLKDVNRILFVRVMDNLQENMSPLNFYDEIYIRENENPQLWEEFNPKNDILYSYLYGDAYNDHIVKHLQLEFDYFLYGFFKKLYLVNYLFEKYYLFHKFEI